MKKGIYTALVTPHKNGLVDEPALVNLIERQITAGIHGLVATGTTGEASTLGYGEHYGVIGLTVSTVAGRVPVLAGVGSNSTDEAIGNIVEAQKRDVDGLLIVTPYYNKPTQEGLISHYTALSRESSLPIILYNVPGRTGVNLEPASVAALAELPNIVGVKEASGLMRQTSEIIRLVNNPDFLVFSGDDSSNLPIYALGGHGAISVASNLIPGPVVDLWKAWEEGNIEQARSLHYEIDPLNQVLFCESNPIPVKTALAMMGLVEEEFRLPLCPISPANREKLRTTLTEHGLL